MQLFSLKASFYTSQRDSAEVQGKDARKSDLQVPQMPFYRNSAVLVLVILVDVYPVAQGIHGDAGGMAKMIAILQSAHDDAGEDVAGARELNGDFFVGQEEILFCKMIETYHGMLTLYDA